MVEPEKSVATPTFRKGKKGKPGSRAAKTKTEAAPSSKQAGSISFYFHCILGWYSR